MLTNFQTSFTHRLSSKFLIKKYILPHFNGVATLPCEMVVLKKSQWPCRAQWSELRYSKQLLQNIHRLKIASFLFTDEKIFRVATPRNRQND